MHKRLLQLPQSTGRPAPAPEKIIILYGNNTHEQIHALSRYLEDSRRQNAIIVCPRLHSRRLRAIVKKQGLLDRAGITAVDDGCEPYTPVEKFRWSKRRYFMREILACLHHKARGWI